MAWTAPKTWTAETGLTAAELNVHIRDNMLETEAAKAIDANRLLMTLGPNIVAMNKPVISSAAATVTTTSTTPTTLGSGTPNVDVTHSGAVLILFAARMRIVAGPLNTLMHCAPEIVGVPAADATVNRSIDYDQGILTRFAGHVFYYDIGAPGTVNVRLRYWVDNSASTGEWTSRSVCVIPF